MTLTPAHEFVLGIVRSFGQPASLTEIETAAESAALPHGLPRPTAPQVNGILGSLSQHKYVAASGQGRVQRRYWIESPSTRTT